MKLFTLSKRRPVGIMVYSSAEIMEAPIETAIKVFRHQVDGENEHFASLDDYYERFQQFLKTELYLFTHEDRLSQCVSVIQQNIVILTDRIARQIAHQYPGWMRPTQTAIKQTARQMITEHHRLYASSNALNGATSVIRFRLRRELRPYIEAWQSRLQTLFFLFKVSKDDVKALAEICLDLILRERESGCETGFVLAGFGEDEYFPRLRSFEFEASIMNVHKIRDIENIDMRTDKPRVVPFAQKEMGDFRSRPVGNLGRCTLAFYKRLL